MFRNRLRGSRRQGGTRNDHNGNTYGSPSKRPAPQVSKATASRQSQGQVQGMFKDNKWHCNCTPRLPAEKFAVKKNGPNHGRQFYTCQKASSERCGFFLWAEDATTRMEAAVLSGKPSEPGLDQAQNEYTELPIPLNQVSVADSDAERSVKKRKLPWQGSSTGEERASSDEDEFYSLPAGLLSQAAQQAEAEAGTPTRKTAESPPETPHKSVKQRQQQQFSQGVATITNGLPTPSTTKYLEESARKRSILENPEELLKTPTPIRFTELKRVDATAALSEPPGIDQDLFESVKEILSEAQPSVVLPSSTQQKLRETLERYQARTKGYRRGRDKVRDLIKAKDLQILGMEKRIRDLEAEIESLRSLRNLD